MPVPVATQERVRRLLQGLSHREMRELGIDALRRWHANRPDHLEFSMHGDFAREFLPLVAERRGTTLTDLNTLKEVFIDTQSTHLAWMEGVNEFLAWFVQAGLAWPLGAPVNQYPITLHLTLRGRRFLELAEDHHPLVPGFLTRLRARCPGLPKGTLTLMDDARACLEHGLTRPAIAQLGLAYEHTIEKVADKLVARGRLASADIADKSAAVRLREVRAAINSVLPGPPPPRNRDTRNSVHDAYDFAETLRRRRNDAMHTTPTYAFNDRSEAEELLVSAGRHFPNLWLLARRA